MKFLREHAGFVAIFISTCLLRFFPLFDYQFTYDELSGLDRTQFSSASAVLEHGVKVDAHPAFVQLLIYFLVSTFGYVNWIVKLPFLLFGQAAIIYAYFFGLRNFSKQVGIVAAIIFGFSLIFVFYAPIARMYISGVFFSLGLLFHFYEIIFNKNQKKIHFILLGFFALLCALNQHINALFAFTLCGIGFFMLTKENRTMYLLSCFVSVILYLPHLPITLYQLSIPGIGVDAGGWLEKPELSVFYGFIKALLGTGWTVYVFVILIVASFFIARPLIFRGKRSLLLYLFLVNFLIVFLYSIFRSPIFQYSVMLFAACALVLFIASYIDYENKKLNTVASIVLFSSLFYQTYLHKNYFQDCVKTVFEEQFVRTNHYKKLYGESNVFPVFFDCDTLMRNIYFDKYKTKFPLKMSSDKEIMYGSRMYFKRNLPGDPPDSLVSTLRFFSDMLDTMQCNYIVLSSASPFFQALVQDRFPYLIENTQTQAINLKVYSKIKTLGVDDDRLVVDGNKESPGPFVYPAKTLPLHVDSINEYPFAITANYGEVVESEGQVILVTAKIKLLSSASNSLECCITASDKVSSETKTYSAKAAGDFVRSKDSLLTIYSDQFCGRNTNELRQKAGLSFFIWNRGKEAFELKEINVKVLDYWPAKWQLWD